MTKTAFGRLIVAGSMTVAMVSAANAYTQEQEAMCTNDAFRLCSSEIPDVERVTACMIRNKTQLSSGCKAVFDSRSPAGPAGYQPAAGRAAKPMSLAPPKTKRTGA